MSYRLRSHDPPSADSKNDNAHNDGQELSPTNAESGEVSSHSSPELPPDVNAVLASDDASKLCVQTSLPPEVPVMTNEVIDSPVSDTTISLRKRPLPLEQPNTESAIVDDLSMGRCYAELKIPSWMGLNGKNMTLH
jgi:hypothetical protein